MTRMKTAILALWIVLLLGFPMVDSTTVRAYEGDPRLASLFDDYWQSYLREYPTYATYLGDHRYDSLLTDYSEAAHARSLEETRGFLERIGAISLDSLSPADSLNHMLFTRMLEDDLEAATFRDYLMPVTQQGGPHSNFAQLPTYHPFNTVTDYNNYIARLRAFPIVIEQTITNMQQGMAEGIVPARVTMNKVMPQLEALMVRDARESILYGPVSRIPDTFSESEHKRIEDEIYHGIRDEVIPALRSLRDFVRDRYLRACRRDPGIWALPDGTARYAYAIKHYTTTDLTPEEIHEIGLRELGRIRGDMRKVTNLLGFRGDLPELLSGMRINPRFYYTDADDLMEGFRAILKRMDTCLPLLFGHLPKQWYDLREIEAFRAASAPAAYYYSAPDDGSRPAYFYVNTYQLESRPKYTMEALAYHEAVPGHHLQLTIQQELQNLPDFRRHGGYTAFVEGWALYAEGLPKEINEYFKETEDPTIPALNAYHDPYSDLGRLTFDAWRAARLVIDTGIHHMKWTREQAIDFLRENTALSDADIVSEVERYIAWPGQALAYKIGQLRILEIRSKAEHDLREDFDIRKFHDVLLEDGALPLDVLSDKMDRWIASETVRLREEKSAQWRRDRGITPRKPPQ